MAWAEKVPEEAEADADLPSSFRRRSTSIAPLASDGSSPNPSLAALASFSASHFFVSPASVSVFLSAKAPSFGGGEASSSSFWTDVGGETISSGTAETTAAVPAPAGKTTFVASETASAAACLAPAKLAVTSLGALGATVTCFAVILSFSTTGSSSSFPSTFSFFSVSGHGLPSPSPSAASIDLAASASAVAATALSMSLTNASASAFFFFFFTFFLVVFFFLTLRTLFPLGRVMISPSSFFFLVLVARRHDDADAILVDVIVFHVR
mmetsp:Transcript_5478/g.15924  ORF Transcript_5478/g.15924 Transcript_5478/m.15924 type:complete len:267 (-) Transcript_5478:1026-1826(-)